ncbi:S8 family serine peptidase [Deinococcus sp.]|uniref:S8 family serine peptidase n=1 Tax=Deinococcus sp. TaxID=47478 RepID=UPI003CC56466
MPTHATLFDPALHELLNAGAGSDEVAVVMRLRAPGLTPAGVRVVARFATVVTARVPRNKIPSVRRDPAVASMKAPGAVSADFEPPELSGPAQAQDQDARGNHRPAGLEGSGRGVVIGHIDWGCDFVHPDFRHEDGGTRLLALWDQRGSQDGQVQPYGYGRVFGAAALNAALAQPDPYAALGYHPADADSGLGAHGTHTLGISAGNGRGGGPLGVAPQAELCFVHLGSREGPFSLPLGDSAELLEALDFISAQAGDRPCAVNMSLGRHIGDHRGLSLVERALDEWAAAAAGRAVVMSCGNYFQRNTHASWRLRPGDERRFQVRVNPDDRTPNVLDLWYSGRDRLGVEVRALDADGNAVDGLPVLRAAPGERDAATLDGVSAARLYHRLDDPNTADNQLSAYFEVVPGVAAWELRLRGDDVQDGRVHAWIERDSGCAGCQSHFPPEDADVRTTLGTVCNGFRTIAVGAYDPHRPDRPLAHFSSSGPTRDGRQKPDLLAPGVMIRAARSQPREAPPGAMLYTQMSGTSMAAPHVTGAVALIYEAAGPLSIAELHRLLLSSCDPSPDDQPAPPDLIRMGSGYLNIARALEAARAQREASRTPAPLSPEDQMPDPEHDPAREPPSAELEDQFASAPLISASFISDTDPEQTLFEFAEDASETDEADQGWPDPLSDVDAELTAFEFAGETDDEQVEGEQATEAEPAQAALLPDRLAALEARLQAGERLSPAQLLLALAGDLDPLFVELSGPRLRAGVLHRAYSAPDFQPLRAALEAGLHLVGSPGQELAGVRRGDLLLQRAGGGPLASVSVVRQDSAALAPVWRATEQPGTAPSPPGLARSVQQRALDDAGRVLPHTLVLRPVGAAQAAGPDFAEGVGPCADVPVPAAQRPALVIRGSVHPAVREAQRKLSAYSAWELRRGQPGLPAAPLQEDCIFGPLTQGAVLEFQRRVFPGVPAEQDGKIGPHTWAQLDAVILLPGPTPTAALTVETLELLDDGFARALTWDDVLGLDSARLNLRASVGGLPLISLPPEIELSASSRPPNGDSGIGTLDPAVTLRLSKLGADPAHPGRARYQASVTPNTLGPFGAVERRRKEMATIVRSPDQLGPGTSDAEFRTALGWTPRGHSIQASTSGTSTGNAAAQTPDALQLMRSGGLEVLELSVSPTPGLLSRAPTLRALVRSPADVMYYSGHGLSASNCLAIHTASGYLCWLVPAALVPDWRSPMDLDVLIIAGCSVLHTDFSGGSASGNGLEWARLLTSKGGPLSAILGYGGSAPADNPVGNAIAREMGARLKAGSSHFVADWMAVNEAHRAWNAVALDTRGYWDFDGWVSHSLRGPRPLP